MLKSATSSRERLTERCAELTAQRRDLDPDSDGYRLKSLDLDDALAALWALGPVDV